jgi:hypothetical protein
MPISMRFSAALLATISIAAAQSERRLTARELFYTPVPEAKSAASDTKPIASKPPQVPAKPPAKIAEKRAPAKTATPPESSQSPSYIQRVSSGSEAVGPPLALRYSLLKQNSDGEYMEVAPDSVFRSGDRIKVSIEANDGAHLYIVQQGSSKAWNVLFPNADLDNGNNRIDRARRYSIPAGGRFTFDEQAGTECLFVILSRLPEPDLEKMIYDLSRKAAVPADASPAPGPPPETRPKIMLAQNRIDDSLVNRLRGQMNARDLVFEKVDDDKPAPGGKREKAMYYGTEDRTARARIVVDLNLRHQ